ncbi:hypothetical protein PR001_g23844 [Phytophthora rubi]|nr:hypothetical protein PR002_g24287 [Phytophthora rubi]KAE8981995.1 hypothetical protein PR001_g23844 [Phytophthora rubi]
MHYYRWQFSKALTVVAGRGDLGMLRWLFEHFGDCVVPVEAVEAAAANGHLAVLKYLREVGAGRESDQDRVNVDNETETDAAEWNGPGNWVCWGGRSMLKAVENGHADVARWLYSNCPYALTDNELELVICGALKRGDIEFAQWLVPPTRSLFDYASDCPHPDVIEMMLEKGNLQRDQNATVVAIRDLATHGQLDLMKRIAQIYTTPPTNDGVWLDYWRRAMAEAIKREDLVMLQWLVTHPSGRELRKRRREDVEALGLLGVAATNGGVEIMQFLHEEAIADDYDDAVIKAVRSGHLNAVKWLLPHVRRLPSDNLMDKAAKYGHLAILEYFQLLSEDTKFGVKGCSVRAMDFSAAHGHLEVVKWLHTNRVEGCTTFAMDNAAANGYLNMVQWLHFNRSEGCTTQAMDLAAQGGHLHILQWLHANRSEGCTFKAIESVISNGHLQAACWLRVQHPQHFPAMVGKSISTENTLEILLFLHVHYPHVFTIWFCARIQRPLLSTDRTGSDGFVVQWLETQYPDHEGT